LARRTLTIEDKLDALLGRVTREEYNKGFKTVKKRKTKAEKLAEKRIDAAYRATCSGIQINILDIPKVFDEGQKWLDANPNLTDDALAAAIRAYVETIRMN